MWGELAGVALVSVAAVAGVATIMLNSPTLFNVLKFAGGGYLFYLGMQLIRSKGNMALAESSEKQSIRRSALAGQGFVTAVSNPKGWAFMISLLPPFIDRSYPMLPQIFILLAILLTIEFGCLVIYATGGNSLKKFLEKRGGTKLLNRGAGFLMMSIGIWLALS